MFSVVFEVHIKDGHKDDYLGYAKLLKPELEQIDGFIDNVRYNSLVRKGWLLSLSNWRDEKALVRWRTQAVHHGVQEKGRFEVFRDYHLRVGQLTRDTAIPDGYALSEQRLDETETGAATHLTMIDAKRSPAMGEDVGPAALARWLGLDERAPGLVAWDVFDAVFTPGDLILLLSWQDDQAADAYDATATVPPGARRRRVRIVRDYGMFDRRETPQYYADVEQPSP